MQIKLFQLDVKVVKCLVDYLEGGVGYKMLEVEPGESKFIITGCITFREVHKEGENIDLEIKILQTMKDKTQFEVQVSNRKIDPSEGNFTIVSDYHLTHDKVKMEIVPS